MQMDGWYQSSAPASNAAQIRRKRSLMAHGVHTAIDASHGLSGVDDEGLGRWGMPSLFTRLSPAVVLRKTVEIAKKTAPHAIMRRQVDDLKKLRARQIAQAKNLSNKQKAIAMAALMKMPGIRSQGTYTGGREGAAVSVSDEKSIADVQSAVDAQQPDNYATGDMYTPQVETPPVYTAPSYMPNARSNPDAPVFSQPGGSLQDEDIFTGINQESDNMQLENVSSSIMFPSMTGNGSDGSLSGMGDIWSDIMTTGMELTNARSKVSIAQSQAAQADAQAREAAALAAGQKKSSMPSTTMMLAAAGGLGLLLVIMKMKRK